MTKVNKLAVALICAVVSALLCSLWWSMPLSSGMTFWVMGCVFSGMYQFQSGMLSNTKPDTGDVLLIGVPLITFMVIAWALNTGMLHSTAYKELLSTHVVKVANAKLPVLDITNAPLISEDMAQSNMEKQLSSGEHSSIGSQFHVGKLTKQIVKGELVWVAPLEFNSFNQWLDASTTPGYVVISAVRAEQAKVVTEINGKKLALKYVASAYFGKSVYRTAYFHNMFQLYDDFTFEIDDEGKPFWVVSKMSRKVGFNGEDAVGALVIDAQTGDMSEYAIESLPKNDTVFFFTIDASSNNLK